MNAGLSYREAAVAGASPVHLVVLLYQQVIGDLRRALQALAQGDIEGRTKEINHALQVIGHLQGTLDRERGGKVAENLARFYAQVTQGLIQAQYKQSAAALEEQIANLVLVYEAWCGVESSLTDHTQPQDGAPAQREPGDWSA